MGKKVNMTVTSRFRVDQKPVAWVVPPPPGAPVDHRLCFSKPTGKLDRTCADLAGIINNASPNALFFLDTNFFTKSMDAQVWDALRIKRFLITPMVREELKPWKSTPFCNQSVRDVVVQAERLHALGLPLPPDGLALALHSLGVPYFRSTELLRLGNRYKTHGYEYYFNLLALRKHVGPTIVTTLEQRLGRLPAQDEFAKEAQGHLGDRGFRLAKKGLEAATSPNLLTDEELVVSAVLTGILRGGDLYILTWDIDLQEQFYKLLSLMTSHYEAMLVGEKYAANPESMVFRPEHLSGEQSGGYEEDAVLVCNIPRSTLANILPRNPHPVYLSCLLLGGNKNNLKITRTSFCAETEMASLLRMKSATGGMNTDKFHGKNVFVELTTFTPSEPGYRIYIGKEKRITIAGQEFGWPDASNALACNERTARYLPMS
jgi:hypothetical protein